MTDSADTAASVAALFKRAVELADIAEVAGVKLYRAGRRLRGECPLCGASKGKRADGAFSADPAAKVFKCWACDKGGDVVTLRSLIAGCSLRQAAEYLAGRGLASFASESPAPVKAPEAPAGRRAEPVPQAPKWIAKVVAEARPILGTPAAAYLYGRAIEGELVQAAFRSHRVLFHPAAPYEWDEAARGWVRHPAMILLVEAVSGFTGGIHCTYLGRTGPGGGWGKAALAPAKKMWGPQSDALGRPGGCWLVRPLADEAVVVGEGAESSLSAAILQGEPCGVLATLDLRRLQGGWATDKWGRRDPVVVRPDPETPALTWPNVASVVIAVDHDMGPVKIKRRKAEGGTRDYVLTPTERASVCASLARQAWRAAGANRVHVIAPPVGSDFNNELQARGRG
jgi:hypothetical protein